MGYTRQVCPETGHGVHKTMFPETVVSWGPFLSSVPETMKHGVHKTDKPETVETWGTQDKKGPRDSGNMGFPVSLVCPFSCHGVPHVSTVSGQWKHGVHKSCVPHVETWGTQDKFVKPESCVPHGSTSQERTNQRQWKHGVHKTRKDKPETVETWGTQDKKGPHVSTWGERTNLSGNMGYTRLVLDKPETVSTWGTQDKKGQTRDS